MSAPPTYRALARREEQRRLAEREAAGKCLTGCGEDRAPGSLLCVHHRGDLDEHPIVKRVEEILRAPPVTPIRTPRVGERRRSEP